MGNAKWLCACSCANTGEKLVKARNVMNVAGMYRTTTKAILPKLVSVCHLLPARVASMDWMISSTLKLPGITTAMAANT